MNGILWFFAYTPLPWLVAMYVAAYRHDLGRLAKPFRDHDDLRAWWSVCRYLGLIKAESPRPARKLWRSKFLLTILVILGITLILPFARVSLEWYYLTILQAASALALFLILVSRIGPLPTRPYKDVLPYPRLGTRIRHLEKRKRREA